MELRGIDVSKHQGKIDWDKVKNEGIDFVMIRMGYGLDSTDEQFERNVKECERVGIPWGCYFYSYALNQNDVKKEIEHTKKLLKNKKPQFPIAFDMEDADGYKQKHGMPKAEELVEICYSWLSEIEKEGYYVSLYANRSWLNGRLKSKRLDRFDKWLAEWADKPTYKGSYNLWQYSSDGLINGIDENVDLNVAYTDFKFKHKKKLIQEYKPYKVKTGDTLSKIASNHNTTTKELMKLNPQIKDKDVIYHDGMLLVPVK
jgi:GH25 family lysozyme M1 (1,4-beta-N-acetylmuramidase)